MCLKIEGTQLDQTYLIINVKATCSSGSIMTEELNKLVKYRTDEEKDFAITVHDFIFSLVGSTAFSFSCWNDFSRLNL